MSTLTKFTAESLTTNDTAHTFDVWAVDFDDAWTVADEFAARNRFGKVDEVRTTGLSAPSIEGYDAWPDA